jgi:glucokinase
MSAVPLSLAVDMGGSKFMVGLVTAGGEILCAERHRWNGISSEGVVRDVKAAARALLAAHPQYRPTVLGATIPGLADPKRGLWVEASFSGIRNLPFGRVMEEEFGLPVSLDNDGRACAVAERIFGCCREVDHFIWITVSNGIGGCLFTGGKPYFGADGNAGEIGHMVVEEGPNARPCKCGLRGCAEMHASGLGLVKNYLSLGGQGLIDNEPPSAKTIAALARGGDRTAMAAYDLEGLYLGRVIGAAVNLINPRKVVIGGGVSLGFDLFWPSLERTLKTHVYGNANPNLSVEPTALGYNAALLGAAALSFAKTR